MDDKTCKRCGEVRPFDQFVNNPSAVNGGNICRPCRRQRDGERRAANREQFRAEQRAWREANREHVRAYGRKQQRELRDAVLEAYGGKCECYDERQHQFLTIDHINGGGTRHRKEVGRHVYAQLRREGYPDGYRVLCWNCNWAYRLAGSCPHREAA